MEFLLLAAVIGIIPAFIAMKKGRSFFVWWFYGFMIFIVALPHALLCKPVQAEIDRRALASGDHVKCPFCAEIIRAEAKVCPHCQRDLPARWAPTGSGRAPRSKGRRDESGSSFLGPRLPR